jgi:hypothetical protein
MAFHPFAGIHFSAGFLSVHSSSFLLLASVCLAGFLVVAGTPTPELEFLKSLWGLGTEEE